MTSEHDRQRDIEAERQRDAVHYAGRAKPDAPLADEFNGDDADLVRSIEALIRLNDDGALVPHGVGDLARGLLAAAAVRLKAQADQRLRDYASRRVQKGAWG